ncbi:hypothetical protein FHR92_005243 [Fontibacillus solani]|uniref:Uncharacterized protein n=1 Tax=Fontibacillus solani TaxID=1572857 RepID=A0A7W3SYU9_9BACL|nr:hypothetical protein [Fontibacillus solani]MBA9088725.1 hypothetical protein [Fontibacillus solani]
MELQEIIAEISEKYPHSLTNASVIRKLNQVQNELFRTTFRVKTMAIFNLQKDVFAYKLPFPQTNIIEVVVNGEEMHYQDYRQKSYSPFFYFIDSRTLAIYPTPDKDVENGLALFYFRYPAQLSETDLNAIPELDQDFHLLLVYGALVQIAEAHADVDMVNNFTSKYNGLIEEFHKANNEMSKGMTIEDVMGVNLL